MALSLFANDVNVYLERLKESINEKKRKEKRKERKRRERKRKRKRKQKKKKEKEKQRKRKRKEKLPALRSELSKVAGYIINIQKSTAYFIHQNEHVEIEIKKQAVYNGVEENERLGYKCAKDLYRKLQNADKRN